MSDKKSAGSLRQKYDVQVKVLLKIQKPLWTWVSLGFYRRIDLIFYEFALKKEYNVNMNKPEIKTSVKPSD